MISFAPAAKSQTRVSNGTCAGRLSPQVLFLPGIHLPPQSGTEPSKTDSLDANTGSAGNDRVKPQALESYFSPNGILVPA